MQDGRVLIAMSIHQEHSVLQTEITYLEVGRSIATPTQGV